MKRMVYLLQDMHMYKYRIGLTTRHCRRRHLEVTNEIVASVGGVLVALFLLIPVQGAVLMNHRFQFNTFLAS